MEKLHCWNLTGKILEIFYDKTTGNNGNLKGAVVSIEWCLPLQVLYLPCRHHIAEIIVSAAYSALFGSSVAPVKGVFGLFQKSWKLVDKEIANITKNIEKDRLMLPFR